MKDIRGMKENNCQQSWLYFKIVTNARLSTFVPMYLYYTYACHTSILLIIA